MWQHGSGSVYLESLWKLNAYLFALSASAVASYSCTPAIDSRSATENRSALKDALIEGSDLSSSS